MTSALPAPSDGKVRRRRASPWQPHRLMPDEWEGQLSHAFTSGWFTHIPSTRARTTVLPRCDAGPTFPSVAASEGQRKLAHSHDLQVSSPDCLRWQGMRWWRASTTPLTQVTSWQRQGQFSLDYAYLSPTTRLSSTAQARWRTCSPDCCRGTKERESIIPAGRASSPVLSPLDLAHLHSLPPGSALLCCPGKVQGPLS